MKKFISSVLAILLVASLSTAAFAIEVTKDPFDGTPSDTGSTFGIIEAKEFPNVSFTVPLYVTMAVGSDQAEVVVPSNYEIVNTSDNTRIGVIGMSLSKIAGSTWSMVAKNGTIGVAADKELQLSIANVPMPAIDAEGKKNVFDTTDNPDIATIDGTTATSTLGKWDDTAKSWRPTPILYKDVDTKESVTIYQKDDEIVDLTLVGKVAAVTRADVATAAQFEVTYIVSPVNAAGSTFMVYAGDNYGMAGYAADPRP